VTPSYQQRLQALRRYAPEITALTERIAVALHPEVLVLSAQALEQGLFDHLEAVGQQVPASVTRLAVWLDRLVSLKALQPAEVATYLKEAGGLGGPSGVVPL
ncbi:MAG: hypothetical protein ACRES5_10605, partial [Pseudomonas sp.]